MEEGDKSLVFHGEAVALAEVRQYPGTRRTYLAFVSGKGRELGSTNSDAAFG